MSLLNNEIYSRLHLQTPEFQGKDMNISSKLITRVTQLPYNVDPGYLKFKKYEIVTTIEEGADLSVAPIPWWVYLLAALAGLLLLLLIIFILYKVKT
jgi:hypothetical protein